MHFMIMHHTIRTNEEKKSQIKQYPGKTYCRNSDYLFNSLVDFRNRKLFTISSFITAKTSDNQHADACADK